MKTAVAAAGTSGRSPVFPPLDELLVRLRAVEGAAARTGVPASDDYVGLLLEADGLTLKVLAGKTQYDALASDSAFRDAAAGLHVEHVVAGLTARSRPNFGTDPPRPTGRAGSPCSAGDKGYLAGDKYGTLGWFFFLDDQLMCISNHHVYCQASGGARTAVYDEENINSASNPRTPIIGRVAVCEAFDPTAALYDCALIEIDPAARLSGKFRDPGYSYPMQLGSAGDIKADAHYFMIGAEPGKFARTFAGVGSYKNDASVLFVEQLYFTPAGHRGDSGAVIVTSGSVVGLYHAHLNVGSLSYSIASPLYRKQWRNNPPRKTTYGVKLPDLSST